MIGWVGERFCDVNKFGDFDDFIYFGEFGGVGDFDDFLYFGEFGDFSDYIMKPWQSLICY